MAGKSEDYTKSGVIVCDLKVVNGALQRFDHRFEGSVQLADAETKQRELGSAVLQSETPHSVLLQPKIAEVEPYDPQNDPFTGWQEW